MPFPASRPSSKYRLKPDAPTGFDEERYDPVQLYLRYKIVGDNQYEFEYLTGFGSFDGPEEFVDGLNGRGWMPFFRGSESSSSRHRADDEHLHHLDIHISGRDAFIEVFTVGNLFWSREQHAVQTKIGREDFYGELRYTSNGTDWDYFDDYIASHDRCQRVRFKAKLNPDYGNRNHKFSFFVLLTKADGGLLEYEIDPDIKNPSS